MAESSIAESQLERRLYAEWALLQALAIANPTRLRNPRWVDSTLAVTLCDTPALPLEAGPLLTEHQVRINYPSFFPALPMELTLSVPVFHPNIHPETGFVCLWDRHRSTDTAEHALHKLVAILGWQLFNNNSVHVMQPAAARRLDDSAEVEAIRARLQGTPLTGIEHPAGFLAPATRRSGRSRLS